MAQLFTSGRFSSLLTSGVPNVGGRLYTYASGTTTHKDAFTDATLTVPCTYTADGSGHLYITLDARGESQVWLGSGAYTFVVTDALGVTIWSVDGVIDPSVVSAAGLAAYAASVLASAGASLVGWMQAATGAVARFVSTKLGEELSIEDFGADVTASAAVNDAAIDAGLAWAGTPTKTIIAGKIVLGLRALKIPARGAAFKFALKKTVPDGVRFYGHSLGGAVLDWRGTGIAIQMGDAVTEHFGISCDNFTILNGGGDTTTSEAIVPINCIRACTISNVMANGFWKGYHPQGEAFGLFMDHLYAQDTLLRALHWEGSTACGLHACRFDGNGEHGIVIDGQSSGGLTPPNNYSPWGVSMTDIVVQGCQKSAVYAIDVQSLRIGGASFFESNNLSNGVWADVYVVQGTAAIKSLVIDVQATFGVGSRVGTTNRALTVNSSRMVRFVGSSVVGAGIFDKGVLLGSDVDRAEVKSYINIGAGNEVDAQPGTVLDYQDSSGNNLLGERTTPLAFSHIQKTKAAGITHFVYNPSSTAGSVAQQLQVGTSGNAGFLLYGLNSIGTNVFRVGDTGDVRNATGTFSTISDETKKNIIGSATSKWNKFKLYQPISYTLKNDPQQKVLLGWGARQVQSISPGLVTESQDFEVVEVREPVFDKEGAPVLGEDGQQLTRSAGLQHRMLFNEDGTPKTTLELKQSIIHTEATVVLQEAQRRIEALEGRIEALEARP
jgi:hypothetical protein